MGSSTKVERKKKGVLREKGRTHVKKKSIKSKALDKNSSRRHQAFGKERKAGHEGVAIRYITRQRAVKKLGVSLKDFRRLCILKGIYPREPNNKSFSKVCYHVKDIAFLAHEPILQRFWEMKTFMKKVRRKFYRKEVSDAKRMMENKPTYTVDHLVRERYPRFQDSLADLDDALCLLHLFANMASKGHIDAGRSDKCQRFCREWQLYIAKTRSLRKVFVSVKGIYYQADVHGETVTWIVPHKFAQNAPDEVDFRVMSTFLEIYESLVGFVLYKLYHMAGLVYPPKLDEKLDAAGAHLTTIRLESISDAPANGAVVEGEAGADGDDDSEEEQVKPSKAAEKKSKAAQSAQQRATESRIASLNKTMGSIVKADKEADDKIDMGEDADESNALENAAFADDEQAKRIAEHSKEMQAKINVLAGLGFFLSREVPFEPLEFVIRAFGGQVLSEDLGHSASDSRVTHVVTDRPHIKKVSKQCEYVQPQWVFDSVNFSIRLPVDRYGPGATLPPHLSPFVNNDAVGYKPEYAEELAKLQAAAGIEPDQMEMPQLRKRVTQKADESDAEEDSDDEEEEKYAKGIKSELQNGKRRREELASNDEDASEVEEDEEEEENDSDGESVTEEKADDMEDDDEEGEEDEEEKTDVAMTSADEKPAKGKATRKVATPEEKPAKKAKLAEPAEAPAKKKQKVVENEPFLACKRFEGAKAGYFFRKGSKGVGYYLDVNAKRKATFKRGMVMSNRQRRKMAKEEEHERAKIVMNGKARRLYNKMQHGINRRQERAKNLMNRRKANK